MVRALLVALLVVIAVIAAATGFGALSNLWADYQDSPTSTYLIYGIAGIGIAAVALWAAARLILNARSGA